MPIINFDSYYDPPEYPEPPYAIKCKKCGRFVKVGRQEGDTYLDYDGMWESYTIQHYDCSHCGELDEKDVKELYA
jgi:hypothetical protein